MTLPYREKRGLPRRVSRGFGRTDLITLVSCVSLGSLLLFTTAASSSWRSRLSICLNNHKQLTLAWQAYAEDNAGLLIGNLDGALVMSLANSNLTWVLGWLDNSGGSPLKANTNTLLLSQYSPLAPYLGRSASVFSCPADLSHNAPTDAWRRVRSVAMNSYLGQRGGPFTAGFAQFRSMSEFTALPPSKVFAFIDEREDSINDGWFPVAMEGSDDKQPAQYRWVDYPADWHSSGANLSFVDGHAETWRWRDPRTTPAHRLGQYLPLNVHSPNNPDVGRLQAVTSRKLN